MEKTLIFGTFLMAGIYILTVAIVGTSQLDPIACPIYKYTGLKCAGCGSQTAVLLLLNFDLKNAFIQNPLLFFLTPYVTLGFVFYYFADKDKFADNSFIKLLYGSKAGITILVLIVFWTIIRNL